MALAAKLTDQVLSENMKQLLNEARREYVPSEADAAFEKQMAVIKCDWEDVIADRQA